MDIDKQEFIDKYFNVFTDENGNPAGKGSSENAYIALQYEESVKGVPMLVICSKWKSYIDQCIANKVADQYISSIENFISKGKYNESFGASLKSKQSSFLDKYKTLYGTHSTAKPAGTTDDKIINYLIGLPEGPLIMEFENKEQQNEFVRIIKSNNPVFVQGKGFVILQASERVFEKKLLKYINE